MDHRRCILGCGKIEGVALMPLYKGTEVKQHWIENIGASVVEKSSFICALHFEADVMCSSRKRVIEYGNPTLLLGYTEPPPHAKWDQESVHAMNHKVNPNRLLSYTEASDGQNGIEMTAGSFRSETVVLDVRSGINLNAESVYKDIISNWSEKERVVFISFYDMSITPGMAFSEIHEILDDISDDDTLTVVIARSFIGEFTFLLGYFTSRARLHEVNFVSAISQCTNFADSIGLVAKAVICDRSQRNVNLFQEMAAPSSDPAKTPFVKINGKKVYLVFDPMDSFKKARKDFLTEQINNISSKSLRVIHNLDKSSCLKMLPSISDQSLSVEFKGTGVLDPWDLDIFKYGVAETIQEVAQSLDLDGTDRDILQKSEGAQEFLKTFRRIFNHLNLKLRCDESHWEDVFTNDMAYLETLESKSKFPKCLQQYMTSIRDLRNDLLAMFTKFPDIDLSNFNQNIMLFAVVIAGK